ncbi:hypothetical protein AVEN_255306-1 [Araneus ventricosus]|uniref:Uncharacterized protein n=1 Tax=Araneus ventricosus TaxID=182803 RepID=A0A4Y2BAF8_ARAVE|nr:hypothetical protein AVEN_255306-1 [Araneus ventricosus]
MPGLLLESNEDIGVRDPVDSVEDLISRITVAAGEIPPKNLNFLALTNFEKSGTDGSPKVPSQDYIEGGVRHPSQASTISARGPKSHVVWHYSGERPPFLDMQILGASGQWLTSSCHLGTVFNGISCLVRQHQLLIDNALLVLPATELTVLEWTLSFGDG